MQTITVTQRHTNGHESVQNVFNGMAQEMDYRMYSRFFLLGLEPMGYGAWSDATTPRTERPVRFVAHAARPDYRTFRGVSGLSSHTVRIPS